MWIQSHHRSRPSIMATFSRGRLANQLNSFAYQYAIWKVNIRISIQNGWADNLAFLQKHLIPYKSKIFIITYVENQLKYTTFILQLQNISLVITTIAINLNFLKQELGIYSYLDSFQLKLLNNVFEFPDPGTEDESIYFEWKEGKICFET